MAWITFTAATLAERITGPEFAAIKKAAKGQGQNEEQMLADCIRRAVAEVRGRVAGHARNILGAEGTIPDELEDATAAIVVYRFISRLPNSGSLLDAQRTKNYEDAQTLLGEVASGKFGIVQPVSPAPEIEQPGGPAAQLLSSRERIAKSCQTNGLL